MPLPITPITSTVTRQESVQCDSIFLPTIHIDTPLDVNGNVTARLIVTPYQSSTGTFASNAKTFRSSNLRRAALILASQGKTKLAQALTLVPEAALEWWEYTEAKEAEMAQANADYNAAVLAATTAQSNEQIKRSQLEVARAELRLSQQTDAGDIDDKSAAVTAAEQALESASQASVASAKTRNAKQVILDQKNAELADPANCPDPA